ncbi:MAG: hypothetical protein H6Q06_2713 [Acidobacteria bacterium]|nr:hypothetical protein [Acidobacteriota bacterium]
MKPRVSLGLNAVIVAVTREAPRILTIRHDASAAVAPGAKGDLPREDALPSGLLHPDRDRTLELGLRRWVREQTGLELGYVEQLYTFGDLDRNPEEREMGQRVLSIAYLALVREARPSGTRGATWRDWYSFFPWEDWREGRPDVFLKVIRPAVESWIRSAPDGAHRRERRERSEIYFGLGGAPWDFERVLDRYELIYEMGLAAEAERDRSAGQPGSSTTARRLPQLGESMALDHRRILATALSRIRGKLKYRPVVFELLPTSFTLLQLQRVVEALVGVRLHKQNLRRLVESARLVEHTGRYETRTGGRPAELFRFRREVLRERPAPGVGLPGLRHLG